MSVHARPASADFAVEILVASDDERTPLHDAEPHSESDDRRMSQQRQLIQLPNGREPRRWISKTDWTDYIKEDPLFPLRPSSVVCIFRVPNLLKDAKKKAYVPRTVSLGPHHHGSAELPQMGHHKGRAMRRMMKRFKSNMDFADRAMEEILKMEKEIRDSYEENIDCDGETLARMLILDGCFILEVLTARKFKGLTEAEEWELHDPIFGKDKLSFAAREILYDILMLENQVPMIVLRKLLELACNSAVNIEKMLLNVLMAFISCFKAFKIQKWSCPKPGEQEVHHLLGFLHTAIVSPPFNEGEGVDQGGTAIVSPPFNRGERVDQGECSIFIKCCSMCTGMLQDKNKARDDIKPHFNGGECVDQDGCSIFTKCCCMCTGMLQDKNKARDDIKSIPDIPRAVELRNAGIKFEQCNGGIKEIKFDEDSATISLPPIYIKDNTEMVFRNLIAFEMCKPLEINHVTCYVRLMDELIDSQEDVALLRRMGVLINWLGSDQEVADLFNGLCRDVVISREDAFNALRKKVNAHYKNKMKVQIAELVREHFSSPWKTLALAAAIVILLLTVVQTIFSIISVYKGK